MLDFLKKSQLLFVETVFFNSVFSAITMAQSEKDSVISDHGDSSVLLCVGTPLLGSLTNLDGFGKLRGECTNPVHDCSSYVRFENQLSFACLNCHGLCSAFSHVS